MIQNQNIFMISQKDGYTFGFDGHFRHKKHPSIITFTSIFVSHKFSRKEILAGKDVLSACTQHKGEH